MIDRQRILITGCNGFIGSTLFRYLRKTGYDVWGIDKIISSDKNFIALDLLNTEQTRKAIMSIVPFYAIIHTAALTHGDVPPAGHNIVTVNTQITENLLLALDDMNTRMIFLSSVAVYGEDGRSGSVSVSNKLHPATDYGVSKVKSEDLILSSQLEHINILRLTPVYDKSHMKDVRKRVFLPRLPMIKMYLYPPPFYSICHINEVVRFVYNILNSSPNGRRIYNVADPEPYNQHQLASWFPGRKIIVPIALIKPLYYILRLLPGKRGYAFRCLFWKLFCSNVYRI